MIVSALYIYPVKSLAGIAVQEAAVQKRGFQYDRRWMLADEDGVFVSQREIPEFALLGTAIESQHLVVFDRKDPSQRIEIPLEPDWQAFEEKQVSVWDDVMPGRLYPRAISDWFSTRFQTPLRLVYMPDVSIRPADPTYAPEGHYVSFADGYPYLLIGQASLDDLNARLETPLPMNRFRPNIVVAGSLPFEEDFWRDFIIGDQPFTGVKPCARCSITTTDQDTAQRGAEPIRTLAGYRMRDKKVLFGQNLVWAGAREGGSVRVGDPVRAVHVAS